MRTPHDEYNGIPIYYDSTLQAGYVRLFPAISPLIPFQLLDGDTQRAWRAVGGLDRPCYVAVSREAFAAAMHAVDEGRR